MSLLLKKSKLDVRIRHKCMLENFLMKGTNSRELSPPLPLEKVTAPWNQLVN
jgi:hypothetical protein